ncbi:DUF3021 family protein [Clostridium thermarum]|uniref:DUF3021 family protein n=1 Tax=Clostridium thermarum TaxID=1716543 RepID=UPI00111FEA78|nr:DUF3021 family protein [Clostridium thermarum]
MKRFMELVVQFKLVWGLIFTASILLYTVYGLFTGQTTMDFVLIWQFVVITMVLVLIHFLIFGEYILTSLKTKYKILIHYLLCYIASFISSNILKWVDISKAESVVIFTGVYTAIYLMMSFSLYAYYKGTGEQLNDKLAAYKQNKKIKGEEK